MRHRLSTRLRMGTSTKKIATPSASSLPKLSASPERDRGLRLVSILLPLGEQPELVRCPVGPAGWHGRRVVLMRRKCSKHFVSIVRIRHEGVVVQLYAVPRHVRNIDSAKQWSDITRERNLAHTFSFLSAEREPRI